MFPDDALDGGKSNACSLKIFGAVEALEDGEQLAGVLFVEACAVVANKGDGRAVLIELADFDDGKFAPTAVFEGIRNQIREYLLYQAGVAIYRRQSANAPIDSTACVFGLEFGEHFLEQGVEVRGNTHQPLAVDLCQLQ